LARGLVADAQDLERLGEGVGCEQGPGWASGSEIHSDMLV
jgi:hypothetical protein